MVFAQSEVMRLHLDYAGTDLRLDRDWIETGPGFGRSLGQVGLFNGGNDGFQ